MKDNNELTRLKNMGKIDTDSKPSKDAILNVPERKIADLTELNKKSQAELKKAKDNESKLSNEKRDLLAQKVKSD